MRQNQEALLGQSTDGGVGDRIGRQHSVDMLGAGSASSQHGGVDRLWTKD
jgi:hypothetical protein